MLFRKCRKERRRLPLGEGNVAIPFWMGSKQFIPGRAPIQKHQRIHFLLLNPDYIVEIFVSRILVAPLANLPPSFVQRCARKKENDTAGQSVAPLWVLREDIFYPGALDNLGFRSDRERNSFCLCVSQDIHLSSSEEDVGARGFESTFHSVPLKLFLSFRRFHEIKSSCRYISDLHIYREREKERERERPGYHIYRVTYNHNHILQGWK